LKSIGYNLWEEESAGLQWWIPKNQTRWSMWVPEA
jgi:hypothetical protein